MALTPPNHGTMIEYVKARLYLASYATAPNENTPFPFLEHPLRSHNKQSSGSQSGAAPLPPAAAIPNVRTPVYFTVENELLYHSFNLDFGPLHIGNVYHFGALFREFLRNLAYDRRIVFWSKPDPKSRTNAACLLACFMVIFHEWSPHAALKPIAQADPPYMPFRDAVSTQPDFLINVQDVVYGVYRAKKAGLCGLKDFNYREYERYARLDQGDCNWVTPQFLAFASPRHKPVAPILRTDPFYATLPKSQEELRNAEIPGPFKNVLSHCSQENVGLVVRLNSELYSPTYFTALGINHIDIIFDDGTCPTLPMVNKFVKIAHEMITVKNKAVAVHCKAGRGRTGCLIGAYLIYRHGFTANEIIAYLRFMRPGMVMGVQQHWLHLNQDTFRSWWWEDTFKKNLATRLPMTPTNTLRRRPDSINNVQTVSPPDGNQHGKRSALGQINHSETRFTSNLVNDNLSAPTLGQPRKTDRMDYRHHPYSRTSSATFYAEKVDEKSGEEVVGVIANRKNQNTANDEIEELRHGGVRTVSGSGTKGFGMVRGSSTSRSGETEELERIAMSGGIIDFRKVRGSITGRSCEMG